LAERVEVRISQAQITATALGTGELACTHERSFARHRTITALEHARSLRERRGELTREPEVEIRLLSAYDALIA
jgi:hypothetical protein